MKNVGGVWLPDGEEHLAHWMRERNERVDGALTYQYHKLQAALAYVKAWRVAIDVGAHCGLWSMQLVKRFAYVNAFEPVEAHRACWRANLPQTQICGSEASGNAACLHPEALGEHAGFVSIETAPTSSGDSRVAGPGDIPMRRLDDYAFEDVDFIKLDCEGYELFALLGGEETLKRWRPCVIVEQKPGHAEHYGLPRTGAVDYLRSLGAKLRRELGGDYILSWD